MDLDRFGCLAESSQVLDHSYLGSVATEIEGLENKSYIVKQNVLAVRAGIGVEEISYCQ